MLWLFGKGTKLNHPAALTQDELQTERDNMCNSGEYSRQKDKPGSELARDLCNGAEWKKRRDSFGFREADEQPMRKAELDLRTAEGELSAALRSLADLGNAETGDNLPDREAKAAKRILEKQPQTA